jgi:dipeptidyl aminopeptidase/acylaminoacyl peptidase
MALRLESLFEVATPVEVAIGISGSVAAVVEQRADLLSDSYRRRIRTIGLSPNGAVAISELSGDLPRWAPGGETLAFRWRDRAWVGDAFGSCPRPVAGSGGVREISWSPTGDALALLCAPPRRPAPVLVGEPHQGDELVIVWPASGRSWRVNHIRSGVTAVAWRPDGIVLAAIGIAEPGQPAVIHLLDVGGRPPDTVHPALAAVQSLEWSADGQSLLVAGKVKPERGRNIALYRISLEGSAQALCPDLDRNIMVGSVGYPGIRPRLTDDGLAVLFTIRERGGVQLLRLSLKDRDLDALVGGGDEVVTSASSDGGRVLALVARPDSPGELYLLDRGQPGSARRLPTPSYTVDTGGLVTEQRLFEAPDGRPVPGWLMRPKSTRGRLPLLLDIHGGPHNAFSAAFTDIYLYRFELVQRGWGVLFTNPRGSDGYGEEHMMGIQAAWGTADQEDFLASVRALVHEGVADESRLAVTGYSYGGYMSQWLTARTSYFGAAVVGGGVCDLAGAYATSSDWQLFASSMGGTPDEHPGRYRDLSPLTYADGVRAPTLLMHGGDDRGCPVGQAESWHSALRGTGTRSELVIYPGAEHLFIVDGRPSYRRDYGRRLVEWLDQHLPNPGVTR